jgi:hypothetical protein
MWGKTNGRIVVHADLGMKQDTISKMAGRVAHVVEALSSIPQYHQKIKLIKKLYLSTMK